MITFPKEREKREGLIGTILFHLILVVFFLFYGLTHMVPYPEQGLTVNFGDSATGMGDVEPIETGAQPEPQPDPVEEVVPTPVETTPEVVEQDVVTQDNVETIETPKPKEPTPEEIEAKKAAEAEAKRKKEQEDFKRKMAQTTNKFANAQKAGGSEGDDDTPGGNKGQLDGAEGKSYTGGGSGNGNYSLGDREALTKPKPLYDCQEEGKVVVDIKVDRNGKVVYASVGKGTTNTAECLTAKAIQAAYKTQWQAKNGAPIEQRGKITYHFILE